MKVSVSFAKETCFWSDWLKMWNVSKIGPLVYVLENDNLEGKCDLNFTACTREWVSYVCVNKCFLNELDMLYWRLHVSCVKENVFKLFLVGAWLKKESNG